MGAKPTRKWKRFLLYLAGCLIGALLIGSCTAGIFYPEDRNPSITAARHLALGECRLLQGDYAAARWECDAILEQFPGQADDRALYLLGMVLVHPDNPMQDIDQAAACFQRIVDRHPNSDLVAAAQTWLAIIARLEENDRVVARMETASAALEQRLNAEKDQRLRLEERLQQMKAIDLTVE
jgi:tetratricopeptide (TPR) repeat protein